MIANAESHAPSERTVANRVIACAAAQFGVPIEDLLSKMRSKAISEARQAAIYVLREQRRYSYVRIGEVLARDHSSVIRGYRAAVARAAASQVYSEALRAVAELSDTDAGMIRDHRTVARILVCVGVGPDGSYTAFGSDGLDRDALRARVAGSEAGSNLSISWVEAIVPRPHEPIVTGTLTP